ncbi:hypothetical protein AMATHDRAFT_43544 [Amanita thiersii Skay4041]|uniref:Uncharacterized protein n=1 Tax=Amanita thiersii Skay4041 TaxID=703135 RepID=A0A2A9NB49_9AGAR|nr:hypothetical protein AMATHDRAFT_43544 [Amanita thiersii Skay4041]
MSQIVNLIHKKAYQGTLQKLEEALKKNELNEDRFRQLKEDVLKGEEALEKQQAHHEDELKKERAKHANELEKQKAKYEDRPAKERAKLEDELEKERQKVKAPEDALASHHLI